MRIISGKYKGRTVKAPLRIRPTQDKVREALFDILGDIQGLSFLELFAGSGAVGLEALSRGAAESALVENNRDCLKRIEQNIACLKARSCQLFPLEVACAIKRFHKHGKKFDIIFLDPPYYKELSKKTLQMLGVYDILAPDGLIIAQHFKKESLPEAEGDLTLFRQSCYGDTALSFYKKILGGV